VLRPRSAGAAGETGGQGQVTAATRFMYWVRFTIFSLRSHIGIAVLSAGAGIRRYPTRRVRYG
jgi:hypothetical protein